MINPFEIFDEKSASKESRSMLRKTKADFGMIPNLEGVMAAAPALLSSYVQSWASFQACSLTDIEKQVVYMTVNFENNCEYCVPWHSKLSDMAKMPGEEIENLRQGRPLNDVKLNTLYQFTKSMVRTRGSIVPDDLNKLFEAGYSQQNALEVVLGVSIKIMSNYTNALAQTPLDSAVKNLSWKKPSLRFNGQ
jgi:alkylhydroperoxidase family enzyme